MHTKRQFCPHEKLEPLETTQKVRSYPYPCQSEVGVL